MEVEIKVGRNVISVSDNDIVMDNGAIVQIITKEVSKGWNSYPIQMSKKLFKDLVGCGFLYTDGELSEYRDSHYPVTKSMITLYRFDTSHMAKVGYKVVNTNN